MGAPFVMLRLNLDDATYCYCRNALLKDGVNIDLTVPTDSVNSRFRDVVEDFGGEQGLNPSSRIAHLVAPAVIKMRLVAMFELWLAEVDAFAATSSSHILGLDGQVEVRQFLVGRTEDERKLADERRQRIYLLDAVRSFASRTIVANANPIRYDSRDALGSLVCAGFGVGRVV